MYSCKTESYNMYVCYTFSSRTPTTLFSTHFSPPFSIRFVLTLINFVVSNLSQDQTATAVLTEHAPDYQEK